MNANVRLFCVRDSERCEEAEAILREAGVEYDYVNASSTGAFATLEHDLGITSVPAAITPSGIVQGLDAIREFVHQANGHAAKR